MRLAGLHGALETQDEGPRQAREAAETRGAADGKFTVPIAATFPLEDWRTALATSLTGQARGKLILLP
jgi:NADPH:quinone reductase-like Zn-dependent oxidoreductase